MFLSLLGLILAIPFADAQDIKDFYGKNAAPRPSLSAEEGRDANVFRELEIPAILAIIKYELAKGSWPELSESNRKSLISIVDDPNLNIVYTGKQSTLAHSSGGQTIDGQNVKIHQDGLYVSGAARPPYQIAKILLHEMGHVYHQRFNYLPRPGRTKEWFPESLEKQLAGDNFTPETIAAVAELLKCPDVSGAWKGTLSVLSVPSGSSISVGSTRPAVLNIAQSGCALTLTFGNNEIKGTYVASAASKDEMELKDGATGTLTLAKLVFEHPDSPAATLAVTLEQTAGGGVVKSESLGPLKKK